MNTLNDLFAGNTLGRRRDNRTHINVAEVEQQIKDADECGKKLDEMKENKTKQVYIWDNDTRIKLLDEKLHRYTTGYQDFIKSLPLHKRIAIKLTGYLSSRYEREIKKQYDEWFNSNYS